MFCILIPEHANSLEKTAANDLQQDLLNATDAEVKLEFLNSCSTLSDFQSQIHRISDNSADLQLLIVGSADSFSNPEIFSSFLPDACTSQYPGSRGGIIQLLPEDLFEAPSLLVIGSDPAGLQYSVYDFTHNELDRDPFQYWTSREITKIPDFLLSRTQNRIISPPLVPILAYFDNDNDELANMTKPFLEFSWEHWQELIQSLVRIKYNAIDLHDHLGRAEFYRWPHYKNMVPDYSPNIELLEKVIDYAHSRGVMLQVSFYLGWKFRVISDKASLNWPKYKQEWIDVWSYYLEHTPIGKCDIFLNRPRDQRWDRKYRGSGPGNDPVSVFNEAFPAMVQVLKKHNPDAIVVVDLYSEGRGVYENGFRPQPPQDYIMVWPDNGFGDFEYLPADQDVYRWGIYMHAGFFLNHVVADPYPELLGNAMIPALIEKSMSQYCLVNGQTFRHYLLNLEVCSRICQNPSTYNANQFYLDWCGRYFGHESASKVVKIFELLHHAQNKNMGYIRIMGSLYFLRFLLLLNKILFFIPRAFLYKKYLQLNGIKGDLYQLTSEAVKSLQNALERAEDLQKTVKNPILFYDHVYLPTLLLFQLNNITLHILALVDPSVTFPKPRDHLKQKICRLIIEHDQTRQKGDRNPKWTSWYNTSRRRPNGGYFDVEKAQQGKIGFISNR